MSVFLFTYAIRINYINYYYKKKYLINRFVPYFLQLCISKKYKYIYMYNYIQLKINTNVKYCFHRIVR